MTFDPAKWHGWVVRGTLSDPAGEPAGRLREALRGAGVSATVGRSSGTLTVYAGTGENARHMVGLLSGGFGDALASQAPADGGLSSSGGRLSVSFRVPPGDGLHSGRTARGVPLLARDAALLDEGGRRDPRRFLDAAVARSAGALAATHGEYFMDGPGGGAGWVAGAVAAAVREYRVGGVGDPPEARRTAAEAVAARVGPEDYARVGRVANVGLAEYQRVLETAQERAQARGTAQETGRGRGNGMGRDGDGTGRAAGEGAGFDREHVEALKRSVSLTHLVGQSVKLDRQGKGLCTFHSEKTPSFQVFEKTGHYHCFGCGAHGDAISWLRDFGKMGFREAVEYLEGRSGITMPRAAERTVPEAAWRPVPVPDGAPPLVRPDGLTAAIHNPKDTAAGTPREWTRYRPQHVAEYRDVDGRLMGYVLRMERTGGGGDGESGGKAGKYTPQVTWAVPSDAPRGADPLAVGRWSLTAMGGQRPLYRAEALARNPSADVVVVMGEKKADVLQAALGPGAVVVSWAGGDNARHLADFGPLRGRRVVVWPDNDPGGLAAAVGGADGAGRTRKGAGELALEAGAAGVRVVIPPPGLPKGWDAGDLVKAAGPGAAAQFVAHRSVPLAEALGWRPAPPERSREAAEKLGRERAGAGQGL